MPDADRPDNLSADDVQPTRPLTDYESGYMEGLATYAHMRDGVLYVGTTGKTLRRAARDYLDAVGA